MKRFLKILGLIVLLFVLGPPAASAQTHPNIVFIYADDLGYGDVSSYGATAVKTPNIVVGWILQK